MVASVEKFATDVRRLLLNNIPDAESEAAYKGITKVSELDAGRMGATE